MGTVFNLGHGSRTAMRLLAVVTCASAILAACVPHASPSKLTDAQFATLQKSCHAPDAYLTTFEGQRMIWFKDQPASSPDRASQAECLLDGTANTDVVGVSYGEPLVQH